MQLPAKTQADIIEKCNKIKMSTMEDPKRIPTNFTTKTKINFDQQFPILIRVCKSMFKELNKIWQDQETFQERYFAFMQLTLQTVQKEIVSVIGKAWEHLVNLENGIVAQQTIIILAKVIIDPIMNSLTEEEKNILKWTCLLHNLIKLGRRFSKKKRGRAGKQLSQSVAIVLDILQHHNFIPDMHDKNKKAALE